MELLKAQLSTAEAQERELCAALELVEHHIKYCPSEGKVAKFVDGYFNRIFQAMCILIK